MEDLPVEQLYKDYFTRKSDKSVIEVLSSRLETWYRALSICKLGGVAYNGPFEKACTDLSSSIGQLNLQKARQFVPVAHSILQKQIQKSPTPEFVDYTNPMLKNKQPLELLEAVWKNLSESDQKLLVHAYGASESLENLKKTGHFPDGIAFALLKARYALKKQLQSQEQISFSFLDDLKDRDLAPLPLYEAKTLKSKNEEDAFEYWLADAPNICIDLIEFAPFAESMRNGALTKLNKNTKPSPRSSHEHSQEYADTTGSIPLHSAHPDEESNLIKYVIIGFVLAVVLFAIFVLISGNAPEKPTPVQPASQTTP
jgi:hypothetical protein